MRRIKLIVAYDGTNYCGWQVQPNGITVQEVLNQALSDLFAKKTACIGASRKGAQKRQSHGSTPPGINQG